ncbi:30S ribosomal protein S17 [Candidatus Gottesmanbacteria bacterium]|nr:30S ribosomal protein S17 [Candidatus Gottesmanbacteria bacterium]
MANEQKGFIGTVVSTSMTKTVTVAVTHVRRHPLYKKQVRRTRRYAAHNESMALSVGDTVRIVSTRPVSKTKHFIVKEKII